MREGAKIRVARKLRREMTEAEQRLWFHLRRCRLGGFHFRRQHPIGPYIADFACVEAHLIIEVDGSQHLESDADVRRDSWFQQYGFKVVRCWNHDVLDRTGQVLAMILLALELSAPIRPSGTFPRKRRKERPNVAPILPCVAGEGAEGGWGRSCPKTQDSSKQTATLH